MNQSLITITSGGDPRSQKQSLSPMPKLSEGTATIASYGVIRVSGEDAIGFLHNQLTHDFTGLGDRQARFSSFCNAKGRIQASFIGIKTSPAEVLLVCSTDLIAQTVKRLSMFVLRSKVKLTDASSQFSLMGVIGKESQFALSSALCSALSSQTTPDHFGQSPWVHWNCASEAGSCHWISLYPSLGQERFLCICESPVAQDSITSVAESEWFFSEIMSGVCLVGLPTYESFVPQMINYESVGGVHFQKGCYPGQEVVARSQFRGTIKRRGFLVSCEAPLHDGQELFLHSVGEQPCGQIVRAVAHQGTYYGFASLVVSATEPPALIHTCAQEPLSLVHVMPPPYSLREDI